MLYLEMSRDADHGGGTWGFRNCIWAPTRKENGASWPFWNKVEEVRRGDHVLHLRGIPPQAAFVGFSTVSSDGYETTARPPDPKGWSFATSFFRADLADFVEFEVPINLRTVFAERREELEAYFNRIKLMKPGGRPNIFFVRQGGKLQCLNGAYLSDVDDDLLTALFENLLLTTATNGVSHPAVKTASGIGLLKTRVGQQAFSSTIKQAFGTRCCFPECPVDDPSFLVGAHIARWSDNEALRGHLGNGLCLCLTHDRAFELGLFTIDSARRVFVDQGVLARDSFAARYIGPYHGREIRNSPVPILDDALLEHWIRVGLDPS